MILWLIGMMGTGKSTVGRLAAQRIGIGFFDTDDIVEARVGETISEIWERSGEPEFRELESDAIREIVAAGNALGATGGGAVLSAPNRSLMTSSGRVVWLKASPDVALLRMPEFADRPLLSGVSGPHSYSEILDTRQPQYASIADHVVDTDEKDLDEVVEEVAALWQP